MRLSDIGKIVLLAIIWGGSFAFMRVAAPAIGSVWFTVGRLVAALLVLFAWARWSGVNLDFRRHWKAYLMVGAANTAIPWTLYAFAAHSISASYMSIVNATTPWFSALLGAWLLGETLNLSKALGLVLGVLGVAVIVGWGPIEPTPAVLLAVLASLAAAAGYAIGGVIAKRQSVPYKAMAVGNTLFATLLLIPLLPAPPAAEAWTATVLISIVAVGVLSTGLGFPLYFQLNAEIGATKAQTITFLVPVSGVLIGVLFLGEPFKLTLLLGGAIILAATALVLEIPLPGRRGKR